MNVAPAPVSSLPMAPARERIAAIDVGSNSIRLTIAEYHPDAGLTIIDEIKDQPRLAEGVAVTGRLDDVAVERAMDGLRRMMEVCRRRGVRQIRAVATAAVREAANGADFIERVQEEFGVPLEIIDGTTEAVLSYRSVAHHFRLLDARTLVADIGGGSLELIGAVDGLVELTRSLPLGAVRLTELYLNEGKSLRKSIARLRRHLGKQFRKELPGREWVQPTAIGSGGTYTNLGRMTMARRGQPFTEAVHGVFVSTAEVEHLLEWLSTMTTAQRAQVPGLNPNRADIILAGLAVTAELLEHIDARGVTVSAYGLREGLLLSMAGADVVPASVDPLLLVREFAERCHADRRHGEHVRYLALILFDRLAEAIGASAEEATLLEAAALLHDVGQLVSYREHHKHSYDLIMHAERLNLSASERQIVAMISRYHRKRGPSRKHSAFAALSSAEQGVVRRMAALLRVADGLDRGHAQAVGSLATLLTPDRLTISVAPSSNGNDLSLECWAAERKADVLAKALKRAVSIVPAISV
ncbi:MAG: Ppx/GppA family phosphatase [Gemmatimonadales bacterium]|nr:Ppx/GppA family phosphatase [Gemmatimonadales bacterium]